MAENAKIEEWKKRLLDIGRTNKLINYKELRVGSLTIEEPGYNEILDVIYKENKPLFFISKSEVDWSNKEVEILNLEYGQVLVNKTPAELKKSLTSLRSRAKSLLEEQGVNILYLAIGFLEWFDLDNRKMKSPILLVPVFIEQDNLFEKHKLRLASDEIVLNPALQLKFESENNITIEGPTEDDLLDVDSYLAYIENTYDNEKWIINKQVELGTFSFQKLSMYKDFDGLDEQSLNNNIVAAVTGKDVEINSEELIQSLDENIENINPNNVYQVLDADSSQQEAILAAKKGLSFVMQGPPGTGKSQTITNIIAECLSEGKKVLFVAEKLAALNVVYNRLKQLGLDEFTLQIHSNKTNKKDVIKELAETLALNHHLDKANYTSVLNTLDTLRNDLNSYISEIHLIIEPFGKSLYEVYGMLAHYGDSEEIQLNYKDIENLSEENLNEFNNLVSKYYSLYKTEEDMLNNNFWCMDSVDRIIKDEEIALLNKVNSKVKEKEVFINEINSLYNLKIEDSIKSFCQLVTVLQALCGSKSKKFEKFSSEELNVVKSTLKNINGNYFKVNDLKKDILKIYKSEIFTINLVEILSGIEVNESKYKSLCETHKFKPELIEAGQSIVETGDRLVNEVNIFNDKMPIKYIDFMEYIDEYRRLSELTNSGAEVNSKWLSSTKFNVLEAVIKDYKKRDSEIKFYKEQLFKEFDKEILKIGISDILIRFRTTYSGGLKVLKSNYHKDIKDIKGLYKGEEKLSDAMIIKTLEKAKEILELEEGIIELQDKLKDLLGDKFLGEYTQWNDIYNSIEVTREIRNTLKMLGQEDNEKIIEAISSNKKHNIFEDMFKAEKSIGEMREGIAAAFDIDTFSIEEIGILTENVKKVSECYYSINNMKKSLCNLSIDGKLFTDAEYNNHIEILILINKLESKISEMEIELPDEIYKGVYNIDKIDSLINEINCSIDFNTKIDAINYNDFGIGEIINNDNFKEYIKSNIDSMLEIKAQLEGSIKHICKYTVLHENKLIIYNTKEFADLIYHLVNSLKNIKLIDEYIKVKQLINESGIEITLIDKMFNENSLEESLNIINKSILWQWIQYESSILSNVRSFNKETYDLKVKKFKVSDKEQLTIARERLKCKLSKERPDGNSFSNKSGDVRILLNEASKKRMHLPIRKLFNTIPELVFKIKPCFLMSPLTVSSFLDVNNIKFDVVIFDEASQICPEDAIGAMLRSKQVIIVGDSEQLPPTSFFTTSAFSDVNNDEESEEIHESILEKCSTIMPTVNLKWHYRSRHEELIAFSNKSIYKNLITIPSSEKRKEDVGVEFIKVNNAIYERSSARVNRVEADKVAELVFEHFAKYPNKSLGVVTFSESQSAIIDKAISKIRMENRAYEQFFSEDLKEPFFIKSIESVQGDERDVIIFSIGYGKDSAGNISMNFGPLSRVGGYRRLNVAITRAKYNVKVVASFEPSDIDLSKTKSEGVKMLRAYMEFAKNGYVIEEDEYAEIKGTASVENEVANILIDNGYEIDKCVGKSEYKINIAVKDPNNNGKYIVAIELDGYEYSDNPTARERFRLREELLTDMGWNFYRIWSTEWINNRVKSEEDLLKFVGDKVRETENDILKEEVELINLKEKDLLGDYEEIVDLDKFNLISTEISEEEIELAEEPLLKEEVIEVAEPVVQEKKEILSNEDMKLKIVYEALLIEAPIHIERLSEKLLDIDKVQKVTNAYKVNVRNYIKEFVKNAEVRDDDFVWPINKTDIKLKSGEQLKRNLNHICVEEIMMAMMMVLSTEGGKTKEELFSKVIEYFKGDKNNKANQRYLINAVDLLFEKNKISLAAGKIKINKDNADVTAINEYKIETVKKVNNNTLGNELKVVAKVKVISNKTEECPVKKISNESENSIEAIFEGEEFEDFREFCELSKIETVGCITHDDIMDFKWTMNADRELLNSIIEIINGWEEGKKKDRHYKKLCDLKEHIEKNMDRLTGKQQDVAQYLADNIYEIHEIPTVYHLSDLTGASAATIKNTLMKLKIGSFGTLKEMISKN